MNQIKNLSAVALIVLSAVVANAQCKDGVCRIPSLNSSSSSSLNAPGSSSFRSPWFGDTSFTSYRDAHSTSDCADGSCQLTTCPNCDCDGTNCICGPNCPPHQQNGRRFPTDNQTRRPITYDRRQPLAGYEAGRLQAPRPASQRHQAASYMPEISWLSNYEQGLEESRKTGRPMLVKVSADWCDYCQKMKRDTYSDRGIVRTINSEFVAVELDADQNRRLIQQMGVRTLPAIVVITPGLKIVDRIEGYKTARQLNGSLLRHTQRAELETNFRVAVR